MTLENAIASIKAYSLNNKCSETYVIWDLPIEDSLTDVSIIVAIIKDGDLYIRDICMYKFESLLKKDCIYLAKDLHVRGEI